MMSAQTVYPIPELILLDAFYLYYQQFEPVVVNTIDSALGSDLVMVARLGDDIDEFSALFNQVYT